MDVKVEGPSICIRKRGTKDGTPSIMSFRLSTLTSPASGFDVSDLLLDAERPTRSKSGWFELLINADDGLDNEIIGNKTLIKVMIMLAIINNGCDFYLLMVTDKDTECK